MERYTVKQCSSAHPWSPQEVMMLQQLNNSTPHFLTAKHIRKYQRTNTLWIITDREQKTIVGIASLARIRTLDPLQTFGILHSVKITENNPDLTKKLRQMMITQIINYALKEALHYIQVARAPGEKKASDIYPGVGFVRVAHDSNAVHGTNIDHLYLVRH